MTLFIFFGFIIFYPLFISTANANCQYLIRTDFPIQKTLSDIPFYSQSMKSTYKKIFFLLERTLHRSTQVSHLSDYLLGSEEKNTSDYDGVFKISSSEKSLSHDNHLFDLKIYNRKNEVVKEFKGIDTSFFYSVSPEEFHLSHCLPTI